MQENKPSQTATWIAKGLLYLEKTKPIGNYMEPEALALYRETIKILNPSWLKNLDSVFFRKGVSLVERITIPGIFSHYFLRKQIIKRWLLSALKKNAEQVIVLAAGFDGLVPSFYQQYPTVNFIEIDHPATQNVKKKAFYRSHFAANNVRFISVDLSKVRLAQVLAENKIRGDLKTFVVIEGLTMYLSQEQNKELFGEIVHYFSKELQIAFSFMKKQDNGSIDFVETSFITKTWLKWQNEVFKWGVSLEELRSTFLSEQGLDCEELICPMNEINLYKGAFEGEKVAVGEYLCLTKKEKS